MPVKNPPITTVGPHIHASASADSTNCKLYSSVSTHLLKKSYKWTHTVQTHVLHAPTVYVLGSFLRRTLNVLQSVDPRAYVSFPEF